MCEQVRLQVWNNIRLLSFLLLVLMLSLLLLLILKKENIYLFEVHQLTQCLQFGSELYIYILLFRKMLVKFWKKKNIIFIKIIVNVKDVILSDTAKIILQHISTLFQRRIEMNNRRQSYIPAASSPTIKIRQSNLPKRLLNKLVITLPILHWYPQTMTKISYSF